MSAEHLPNERELQTPLILRYNLRHVSAEEKRPRARPGLPEGRGHACRAVALV